MYKFNKYELHILNFLLFNPNSRFTDLNTQDLESYHLNYYVKSLLKTKLITKNEDEYYVLTNKGKEIANTLDTKNVKIEKQPKVSVLIICLKGEEDMLITQRLKEPYYGYWGFVTGKVSFGESIEKCAQRELIEETGLSADLKYKFTIQEHIYSKENKMLEDKIFFTFLATKPKGKLKQKFEAGENMWITRKEFFNLEKKFYDEDYLFEMVQKTPPQKYIFKKFVVDSF